jgi:hypothetical protein
MISLCNLTPCSAARAFGVACLALLADQAELAHLAALANLNNIKLLY